MVRAIYVSMNVNKLQKIIIYTDGGARGNPGPAAIGIIFKNQKGEVLKQYGERIGNTTNNVAEYEAVIFALKKAKQIFGKEKTKNSGIEIYVDSELIVKQLSGQYKVEEEHLQALFMQVWNLKFDFGSISFSHVPREKNKEADRMVNMALDKEQESLL